MATFLQLGGLATVIVGGFLVSLGAGLLACGAVAVFVGVAAERR